MAFSKAILLFGLFFLREKGRPFHVVLMMLLFGWLAPSKWDSRFEAFFAHNLFWNAAKKKPFFHNIRGHFAINQASKRQKKVYEFSFCGSKLFLLLLSMGLRSFGGSHKRALYSSRLFWTSDLLGAITIRMRFPSLFDREFEAPRIDKNTKF